MMAFETAKAYLEQYNLADRIHVFEVSSATVELAAQALNCLPQRIAKSLAFQTGDGPILIVAAGDAKVDNPRFKVRFHIKAKMLSHDEVEPLIGHDVGGVCPFGVREGVKIFLDESLKRFDTVFPACGSSNSAVKLTIPELERILPGAEWVDVCKGWREEP